MAKPRRKPRRIYAVWCDGQGEDIFLVAEPTYLRAVEAADRHRAGGNYGDAKPHNPRVLTFREVQRGK